MTRCTVMVGLPAYGKSTFIKSLNNEEAIFVYSTDSYIEELSDKTGKTYNELFPDFIEKAKFRMDGLLDVAINDGVPVYWDQTNLSVWKRRSIIQRMKRHGYTVDCVYIKPAETEEGYLKWLDLLDSREGKDIPHDVINSMLSSFSVPSIKEGFDSVITFDNMFDKNPSSGN